MAVVEKPSTSGFESETSRSAGIISHMSIQGYQFRVPAFRILMYSNCTVLQRSLDTMELILSKVEGSQSNSCRQSGGKVAETYDLLNLRSSISHFVRLQPQTLAMTSGLHCYTIILALELNIFQSAVVVGGKRKLHSLLTDLKRN